jgi:hypothetical protein
MVLLAPMVGVVVKDNTPKPNYITAALACLFGMVLLAPEVRVVVMDGAYHLYGQRAMAVVTDSGQTRGKYRTGFVRYQFTAPDGKVYSGRNIGYARVPGSRVAVDYLPSHPSWSEVSGYSRRSEFEAWPLVIFGGLAFWGGAQAIWKLRRSAANNG